MSDLIINKKGLVDVVSTVLIILLSFVSVALLFLVVKEFISQPAFSPENCVNTGIRPGIEIQRVCYNPSSDETEVTLKRDVDSSNISSLGFKFSNSGNYTNFVCGKGCGKCFILNAGETNKYYFSLKGSDSFTLSVNGCVIEKKGIGNC